MEHKITVRLTVDAPDNLTPQQVRDELEAALRDHRWIAFVQTADGEQIFICTNEDVDVLMRI